MAPNHPVSPFLHHLIVNVQHGCRMAARAFCDTEKRVRRWRRFPRFSPLPVILPRPDCSLHWREAKKEGPSGCIDPGVRKIDSDQTTAWKGEGDRKNIHSTGIFSKSTATIETERKRFTFWNLSVLVLCWQEDIIIARSSANASVSLWE